MSKGISKQQQAIVGILEKHKSSMTPFKIGTELLLNSSFDPTPENLCRALRSLYKRGLVKRTMTIYLNPTARGWRYFTPEQYDKWEEQFH